MIGNLLPYMTPGYIAAAVLSLLVLYQTFVRVRYATRVRRAGGVHAPSVGSLAAFSWMYSMGKAQADNRMLEFWRSIWHNATAESPNTVEINVTGGMRSIITQEPEHIKTVLTGKFADFGKGPQFHRLWQRFLGDSIFNTDHKVWQDSRNLIRKMFIKDRVSDLHLMEKWTQVMIQQIPASGQTFDACDLFYRLTIDIITDFLLGGSVNSLQEPQSHFVKAFAEVQRAQMMLTVLLPMASLLIPIKRRLDHGVQIMEEFIEPFIQQALAIQPEELEKINKSEKSFTFLHALAGFTRDPKVIRDQIVAVLLAGRDTTAATLSWTFYELANKPEVYQKLRQEVLDTVGPEKAPTYDDLKTLKYLNNTMNEALRLYPAVPFNVRYALNDTSLPGVNGGPDITLVKGDAVMYSAMGMQRRLELYPPVSKDSAHPDVFSPDRWENWSPKPWTYIPFNGGPRICVGQNFALVEMAYTIVRLVQRFERMEYRGDWHAQTHKVEIVGTPGHGVPIAFYAAEKS